MRKSIATTIALLTLGGCQSQPMPMQAEVAETTVQAQYQMTMQKFGELDRNRDKRLTLDEFKKGLQGSEQELEARFSFDDANHDGLLTQAEVTAAPGSSSKKISIHAIHSELLHLYDHNRNGSIELKQPDGFWKRLWEKDERVRSIYDEYQSGDQTRYNKIVFTRRDLFYASDDNHDGVATSQELMNQLKRFDTNNNEKLEGRNFWEWLFRKPKGELDFFNDQFGEQQIDYGDIGVGIGPGPTPAPKQTAPATPVAAPSPAPTATPMKPKLY